MTKEAKPKFKMHPNGIEARKYFYAEYEKIKQRPYNASFAKDGRLFHLLAVRFPLSWIKGMVDFYLQWDDEFCRKGGHTIGIFFVKINQILELNIHKSDWVRKHEQNKMQSAGQILEKITEHIAARRDHASG